MRILYAIMAHVNNKFERKTKTARRFHGAGIFFRQCRRRGKFLRPRIALQNASQKEEPENFNHALFALAFLSRRQDRELLGAISRGLLDLHFS
jgi:hypothetical protein